MGMTGLQAYQTTLNATLSAGAYPGDVVVEQPYQLYGVVEQQPDHPDRIRYGRLWRHHHDWRYYQSWLRQQPVSAGLRRRWR